MLLKLEEIRKGFRNAEGPGRVVLDGLSLEVTEGESLAVLGPSGSGKTTLLNLIGGLDFPDGGTILFRGEDLAGRTPAMMDRYRNREVGFVFQYHHLLPQCTLLENVLIPTLPDPGRGNDRLERAEHLLNRVGIWEHRNKKPAALSGGECQRAAVVRAMINAPSILLADEPTGALDRENVEVMADLLLELNQEDGLTLLVVTHSIDLARRIGKTLTFKDGRLEQI